MKNFLQSKTILFNALVAVLTFVLFLSDNGVLTSLVSPDVAVVLVAVVNIGLRFLTSAPVVLSK